MESVNKNEELNIKFINEKRETLQTMLAEVINELDNDQLTAEGFQFFSFTWDKAYDLLKEKEKGLASL